MKNKTLLTVLLSSTFLGAPALLAQDFNGIIWTPWTDNEPEQDRSGSGTTPSVSGATNNQSRYTFAISSSSSSSTQRQEWRYERQRGYTQMELNFRVNSDNTNFDKISIAQCHDDQRGSEGVFSIYQVRKVGSGFVFGVQGDTREASNGYSTFPTQGIDLDNWYRLVIQTFTDGRNDSYEYARLYDNRNRVIWDNTIEGGGDVESYYKLGVYRLTGGFGPVSASFENIRFSNGQPGTSNGGGNSSDLVTLTKSNATGFAIDAGNGGANGQNVYLWSRNTRNVNQQFQEINRGSGYFSYVKNNTNFALDGGNGGARNQNLYIWSSNSRNYNQQWRKVSAGNGKYQLQKRNSLGYSINGGGGGSRRQNVNIYDTVNNGNLHWIIE